MSGSEPVVITPRAAWVLLAHLDAKRLRRTFRADDEVYPVLTALGLSAVAYEEGSGDAADGMIIAGPGESGNHECVNVGEAAKRSGWSPRTIRAAIERGDLRAHRSGGYCIHSMDLAAWLFRQAQRERRKKEKAAA